jgi:hypothetical protein
VVDYNGRIEPMVFRLMREKPAIPLSTENGTRGACPRNNGLTTAIYLMDTQIIRTRNAHSVLLMTRARIQGHTDEYFRPSEFLKSTFPIG